MYIHAYTRLQMIYYYKKTLTYDQPNNLKNTECQDITHF